MSFSLLKKYIWLVDTIRSVGHISREDISRKWSYSSVNEKKEPEYSESTFHRNINEIRSLFNIDIQCNRTTGHYYIGLISGVGFEIYETLSSDACRESISLSAITYGLPTTKPDALIQLEQLRLENTRLTNQNKQLQKTIKSMKQEQDQRPIIKKFYGPYIENNNLSGGNQILTAENVYLPGAENVSISNAKNINKPECSEAPQSPVTRGRRIQYLFMDEYDHEDSKRTKQEAARVKQYVADHHWGQMRLDSKSTNRLNLMVACFWYYWHDRNWVPDIPQGAAIYRFVTEQCNLPCDVHPRAFMSAITRLINNHRKDPETYANLRTYFPQ